ncbi:DUF1552 domain-containing protein [Akkermansiaceae bacterium]|nr:DUF1552 domain-containing protein [bacterium]MDA7678526.1 DUF1552 domain-containing protein [Akkermansiaceae bacterium]MDA7871246.1 DUF1552 domain-containing protein [Akkermansiaceae bacterium]MDB4432612.1 DUF1552 domain-containing protein [Akkermansiaceae bacterium]MDB4446978.1 DUF1552 domain-containing protein [Akkermansiaceae bacterium]
MNYLSQSWRIDRRHALRAMGTCISLPFLECMVPLRAAEQATASPRRSAFIYLANGVHSLNYQILTPGMDYQFSQSLKPLEKHREVITPVSGLHHPGALGHHHNCISVFLTGGKLGPSDRNTISVDQKMAEITAQQTRYPSMEIALTQGSLAWTADGVQLPALRRCSEIFDSLFEEPKGGVAARRKSLRQKASVLDDNLAEVRRLEKKMGTEDKGRLDQYLTSVREAEIRTRRADDWLDTPLPEISEADRKRTKRDIPKTQAGDYFRTVYDLMVLAFQTDVTRVATFSLGGEGDAFSIPEIGITESRHQLSHHGGDAGYMEKLTNYDTFAIEQFSYFLTRLAETKDLNGKPLLDTTMSLFGSGMCYGHSHGNANLPLVLAGGTGLGLKHGSHLDFNRQAEGFKGYSVDPDGALTSAHYQICGRPVNSDAHMSNLLLLMAQKMGLETDHFGDSNKVIGI